MVEPMTSINKQCRILIHEQHDNDNSKANPLSVQNDVTADQYLTNINIRALAVETKESAETGPSPQNQEETFR